MSVYSTKFNILIKSIAISLILAFIFEPIAYAQDLPASHSIISQATLAAELRLKPFFEANKLEFQNMFGVIYAARRLRELLIDEHVSDDIKITREINRLNRLFPDGSVKINENIQPAALQSGRAYKCAVFKFDGSKKPVNVLFFPDYTPQNKLKPDELRELRIDDEEKHHLDCPGLEGAWFVNRLSNDRYIDNIRHAAYASKEKDQEKFLKLKAAIEESGRALFKISISHTPEYTRSQLDMMWEFLDELKDKDAGAAQNIEKVKSSISELAINMMEYGQGGVIVITPLFENSEIRGMRVDSMDTGPGVGDLAGLYEKSRAAHDQGLEDNLGFFYIFGEPYVDRGVAESQLIRWEMKDDPATGKREMVNTGTSNVQYGVRIELWWDFANMLMSDSNRKGQAFSPAETWSRLPGENRGKEPASAKASAGKQGSRFARPDDKLSTSGRSGGVKGKARDTLQAEFAQGTSSTTQPGNSNQVRKGDKRWDGAPQSVVEYFSEHYTGLNILADIQGDALDRETQERYIGTEEKSFIPIRVLFVRPRIKHSIQSPVLCVLDSRDNSLIGVATLMEDRRSKEKDRYTIMTMDAFSYGQGLMQRAITLFLLKYDKVITLVSSGTNSRPAQRMYARLYMDKRLFGEIFTRGDYHYAIRRKTPEDAALLAESRPALSGKFYNQRNDGNPWLLEGEGFEYADKYQQIIPVSDGLVSAKEEAKKIHDANIEHAKYMPMPNEKKMVCHIIADSVIPYEQRERVVKRLEQDRDMRSDDCREKVIRFEDVKEKDFIATLKGLIEKKRSEYEARGFEVEFDLACPDTKLVAAIMEDKTLSKIGPNGVRALAFKSPELGINDIQVEGIMVALRALRSGDLDVLRRVYNLLSGRELSKDELSLNDINDFVRRITFTLPAVKVDFSERRRINDLIVKKIKTAA